MLDKLLLHVFPGQLAFCPRCGMRFREFIRKMFVRGVRALALRRGRYFKVPAAQQN